MEWEEFLNHPIVIFDIESHYNGETPGKHLFGKTLWNILTCLNGYKGWVKIASSMEDIPLDIKIWFSKWNPVVEIWTSSLTPLWEYYYKNNTDWQNMIAKLGSIPVEASLQYAEVQDLTLPTKEQSRHLVIGVTTTLARLNLICKYIQNWEYLNLWTIEDED